MAAKTADRREKSPVDGLPSSEVPEHDPLGKAAKDCELDVFESLSDGVPSEAVADTRWVLT